MNPLWVIPQQGGPGPEVEAYVIASVDLLNRSGFNVMLRTDMAVWRSTVVDGGYKINPTFDPDLNALGGANAFWLQVTMPGEGTVGCIANRVFATSDYVAIIENGTLWYEHPPATVARMTFLLPHLRGHIKGAIGHHGGLWVAPQFRGQGLSWILPRLTRALSILRWDVDWHCGMVFGSLRDRGVPTDNYGYSAVELCIDGYFPPTDSEERLFMTMIRRYDMDLQIVRDLDLMKLHADKQVIDFAPIARQRQDQPLVATPGAA